ncbi:putative DNA-dependent RNA polymerase catalyzes the transcription of DNA into RNA using the four ribonucleoside triphosphates as substrates [Lyophyllum shimeji]|uniref:DNA-directed RNA polymerase n=1 Tax=Lyophyllum shimeji TaxID=47721 RepID=A0A9P3PZR4_LYOSH|nr:putative DNA-dependent RNA polymerase catalyzes the transcription of DNA into RNA using the four ribonucleoside triphosphates as substrates [Lyophyllum shimeji]
MVVNSDGTLSRIANWEKMTDAEKATTLRVVAARNQKRLAELKAEEKDSEIHTPDRLPRTPHSKRAKGLTMSKFVQLERFSARRLCIRIFPAERLTDPGFQPSMARHSSKLVVRQLFSSRELLLPVMIPRAVKRLETTLLSSRQGLPRPARLYSTPSKKANAPAFATAQIQHTEYPSYLSQPQQDIPLESRKVPLGKELAAFLQRTAPYTILPAPLPSDRSSPLNDIFYPDTTTQDLLSVMDACLHNLYDVPRARGIFERLREKIGNPVLSTHVYNAFLEAYVAVATTKGPVDVFLEYAWELYNILESEKEQFAPDATTYAIMLLAYHRFRPDGKRPLPGLKTATPSHILSCITQREIPVANVVSDRTITSSEEAVEIIKLLSKTAMQLNMPRIISELGQAELIGAQVPDALDNVPEANPVLRVKKRSDAVDGEEPEMEVPFNIDNLRRHLAEVRMARRVLSDDVAARQKLLEESVYDVAVERLKHQADLFADLGLGNNALRGAELQKWMWDWHTKLTERLEKEVENIAQAEGKARPRQTETLFAPYLSLVKPSRLSLITILEIMRLQGSGGIHDGMKTTRALVALGRAVEIEYKSQICRANKIYIPATSRAGDAGYFSKMGYRNLLQRRVAAAKVMSDAEGWTAEWTQHVRSKIGGILVECLMDVAEVRREGVDKNGNKIFEVQPAFYHTYEYMRGQKLGVIRLNPVVSERLAKDRLHDTLHPRHLPMLVKPKPWVSHNNGGYLYNKTHAMRFKESAEQMSYLKHAAEAGNVELVFAGLDVLGSTPWQINKQVFDVVLEVWNRGERMGKLPPAVHDEPEPQPPENMDTDIKAKSIYLQRLKAWSANKANNHSDRCSVNYKIEIARAFLGDTIYLPHNLDFRGRAYPIPPHLSHIGDDLSRGLLKFGEAKPLGERGLRWLKIHLSNLYGFDKAPFDERVEFVEKHLDDIYDSATKPLEGRRWWLKADDPWQCLATCMELHAALESGDPHAFMSSLPVHQDGTCNGLQHYAALGGDDRGAQQVNLAAGDRPSDVYTHVGEMVEQVLDEDAKKGERYAIMLKGKISRKVVKQTVMTTVYGVTFVGAREQIERQLKDKKVVPDEECWKAASYLASKTIQCIGDLFSGATAIQNWFSYCARLISRSIPQERLPEAMAEQKRSTKAPRKKFTLSDTRLKKEQMTSVVWTTPLGLPIVQPYRKANRKQIKTSLQTVYISDPNSPAEVNSLKQASAFPPNFIHSLDATHMMLTALECRTQGLTFASVHDSYWTHACSIDKMSEIIRDTFIALHSSDVLQKLDAEFRERYKNYKVPLTSLRVGKLLKGLHSMGSRIVVTPEQAKSLGALQDLLVISETEKTTVDESEAERVAQLSEEVDANAEEDLIDEEEDIDENDEEAVSYAAKKKANAAADKALRQLMGKFVNVTDLLPPLPEKGKFDVESIKKSQYFFS